MASSFASQPGQPSTRECMARPKQSKPEGSLMFDDDAARPPTYGSEEEALRGRWCRCWHKCHRGTAWVDGAAHQRKAAGPNDRGTSRRVESSRQVPWQFLGCAPRPGSTTCSDTGSPDEACRLNGGQDSTRWRARTPRLHAVPQPVGRGSVLRTRFTGMWSSVSQKGVASGRARTDLAARPLGCDTPERPGKAPCHFKH